jgi:hypothetical protein
MGYVPQSYYPQPQYYPYAAQAYSPHTPNPWGYQQQMAPAPSPQFCNTAPNPAGPNTHYTTSPGPSNTQGNISVAVETVDQWCHKFGLDNEDRQGDSRSGINWICSLMTCGNGLGLHRCVVYAFSQPINQARDTLMALPSDTVHTASTMIKSLLSSCY